MLKNIPTLERIIDALPGLYFRSRRHLDKVPTLERIIHKIPGKLGPSNVVEADRALDPRKKAKILAYVKTQYGMVPEGDENFYTFLERVDEEVNRKDEPLDWFAEEGEALLKDARRHVEATKRIQGVSENFLGIKEEPLCGYIADIKISAAGFCDGSNDRTNVIVISRDAENDYPVDIRDFAREIRGYLRGETPDKREGSFTPRLLMTGSHLGEGLEKRLFTNWMGSVYKNFDLLALHESIHNLDYLSRPSETAKLQRYDENMARKILSHVPLFRHIVNMPFIQHTVDFEANAFKVSIDAYIEKSFSDVRKKLRLGSEEDSRKLYDLEQKFYEMSSTFSKRMIKIAYLSEKKVGGIIPSALKIGTGLALYNWLKVDDVTGVWTALCQGYAYMNLVRAAYHAIDAPSSIGLSMLYKIKTNRYVNAWQRILRNKGIKPGYQDTMGMKGPQRVDYARGKKGLFEKMQAPMVIDISQMN